MSAGVRSPNTTHILSNLRVSSLQRRPLILSLAPTSEGVSVILLWQSVMILECWSPINIQIRSLKLLVTSFLTSEDVSCASVVHQHHGYDGGVPGPGPGQDLRHRAGCRIGGAWHGARGPPQPCHQRRQQQQVQSLRGMRRAHPGQVRHSHTDEYFEKKGVEQKIYQFLPFKAVLNSFLRFIVLVIMIIIHNI